MFMGIFPWIPADLKSQNFQKIFFDDKDSADGYYLAFLPLSGQIQGVQVLFTSFTNLEMLPAETKLQNVAYGNGLLTVMASMKQGLCADSASLARMSRILQDIETRFSADSSKFALGGFEYAATIVLRYAERSLQDPSQFPVRPKAVFLLDCPVDMEGLVHWCEREIKKNYFPGNVGDANFILNALTKMLGPFGENREKYLALSPFCRNCPDPGPEQLLKNLPLRLYYDTDIGWELRNRQNSFYDTYLPDGSELVSRLLQEGNPEAEFLAAPRPALRSSGLRNPHSWSIVEEVECVQWIKQKLGIFDANTYLPVYHLEPGVGWGIERFPIPIDFAPEIRYKGVEDVRFSPGFSNPSSGEYWSYCFLWWLNPDAMIDEASLQADLTAYYGGLIARNIIPRKIPKDKLIPTKTEIIKLNAANGDLETFSGKVQMLDYIIQRPMQLNFRIHVRKCNGENHLAVFFEVSPRSFTEPVWQSLDSFWTKFLCKN
jgi:hypothetical protein